MTINNTKKYLFTKILISGGFAIMAMFITFILVLLQDIRVWAILGTGILVFLIVIIIISINRYRWMANIVLGGLITSASWIGNNISATAHLNKETSIGIMLEASSWIEPVSLTICFIALLIMDLVTNYIIPYFRNKKLQIKLDKTKDYNLHKFGKFRITSKTKGLEIVFDGPLDTKFLKQLKNIMDSPFFSNIEDNDNNQKKNTSKIEKSYLCYINPEKN